MYHAIEFTADLTVDLVVSPKQPLERLRIQKHSCRRAQIKPYVVHMVQGPVEVADLFFDDGTSVRQVGFACFRFAE